MGRSALPRLGFEIQKCALVAPLSLCFLCRKRGRICKSPLTLLHSRLSVREQLQRGWSQLRIFLPSCRISFSDFGFSAPPVVRPLRVELFSRCISARASPARLSVRVSQHAPRGGFSPLSQNLTHQAMPWCILFPVAHFLIVNG